jgi:hypothetical protein
MRSLLTFPLSIALAVAAGGCHDPAADGPLPLSVTPDRGPVSQAVPVTIRGTHFDATATTDFAGQEESALDVRFAAFLGPVPLRDVRLQSDGALTAIVPDGLPVGTHDLRIVDPDGREGSLSGAYRVLADTDTAQLVVAFRIDAIGPQQAWAPFAVTVTAIDASGATVAAFNGSASLQDLTGSAVPGSAGLFRSGVWTAEIEIRSPHAADLLTATDGLGHTGSSNPFPVAPSPAVALAFTTQPRTTSAGDCSGPPQPLTIALLDAFGGPTVAAGVLALSTVPAAGLELFSDDQCTAPLPAPTFAAGAGSMTVWYRSTRAGDAPLDVSAPSLRSATQHETVLAGPPAAVTFLSTPQTVNAGACSQLATVELRDAWGNPAAGGSPTIALAATEAAGFELFSDAGCSNAVTAIAPAPGAARADFYFRGILAEIVTVTATSLGLAGASQNETITPEGSASRLVFLSPPLSSVAGGCSGLATVQAQDSYGNAVAGAGAVQVALGGSPAAGFAFFADELCSAPIVGGAAEIGAGLSTTSFYFLGTAAGSVTVGAASTTLTAASQVEQVTPGPPMQLVFTSAPQNVAAGACSGRTGLALRDAFGNATIAAAPVPVTLDASPATGFAFYADALCTTPATAVIVPSSGSGAGFYFKGTAAGTVTVSGSSAGLGGASQTEQLRPAAADRLAFKTAVQTVTAGDCSGAVTVEVRDPNGNASPVPAATNVALGATPASGFAFYSDAACTTPVPSVAISAGGTEVSFFFRCTAAADVDVTATTIGLAASTQRETVTPAAADRLVFSGPPQPVAAGSCSATAVVEARDPFGNPSPLTAGATLALAASPSSGFTFHAGATCGGAPTTSVSILPGASSVTITFKGTAAGSVTITASSAPLAAATQNETIVPVAPDRLAFTTSQQSRQAGSCSAPVTLQTRDLYSNPSPVSAPTTVGLSASPAAGFAFYSDAACSVAVASVSIPAASSGASFYFRGTAPGAFTVSAAATGLTNATQVETVTPAAPDHLGFTSTAQTLAAGICSATVTLQSHDLYDNGAPVAALTAVALAAAPSSGFVFYAGAGCSGAPVASIDLLAGASSVVFSFRATAAGSITFTADAIGLAPAPSQVETVTPAAPNHLVFTSAPQSVTSTKCSGLATLETRDPYENGSTVSASTSVGLAAGPPGGFAFYSDAACTSAVTSTTIPGGSASAGFWFKGNTGGVPKSVTITASPAGLTAGSQVATITPAAAPTRLVITTPPQTVAAGSCAAPITVQGQDSSAVPRAVVADTTLSLSSAPAPGLAFYSGAACTGTPVTSVVIPAGADSVDLWFLDTSAGNVTITASSAPLTAATQAETIAPVAPDRLAFTTSAQSRQAGSCSAITTLQSRDSYGNPSTVAALTAVALSATPAAAFAFYSDAACSAAIASVSIPAGGSGASFYFKGTAPGAVTISAAAAGLTAATQGETVTPASPDRLAVTTSPQTRQAGACSASVTLQTRDLYGNPSAVAAVTPVALTASPAAGFAFYSDAGCTGAVASVSIPAGSSGASFYFKGTAPGAVTISAAATGLATGIQSETITPGAPDHLVFTSAAQSRQAGTCSAAVTLQSRDAWDNVSPVGAAVGVALSAAPASGFIFYSDAGCSAAVTSRTISAGASSATFYFRGTSAGTVAVTASAAGMSPDANQNETITPAAPSQLAFATGSKTVVAGVCSSAAIVQSRDAYGNVSPVASATTVNLSASPSGGFTLYAGGTCAGGSVGSISLPAGASSTTFSFRGTTAGSVTITASAAGMSPNPTQVETIAPAPPSHLVIITSAQVLTAGTCSNVLTVQSRDAYGNSSPPTLGETVALSAAPATGFTLYANAGCGTSTGSVSIAPGTSSASFWFLGTAAGSVTVTATVTGWTGASQVETVAPAATSRFVWDAVLSPQAQDRAFAVRIAAADAFGNATPGFIGTAALSITADTVTPSLTCNSGCSVGLTTGAFAAGVWTGSVSVSAPESPTEGTPDRRLVATATVGSVSGTSNDFELTGTPDRSPPTARLTASRYVLTAGGSVTFSAATSSDYQTSTANLEVSWDLTGAATAAPNPLVPAPAAPWTAWSTTKTRSRTFATAGTYSVTVAVRDTDGEVGDATIRVYVLPASGVSNCVVTTTNDADDGGTCTSPGPDGVLSLREALRAVATGGFVSFGFAAPTTITGTGYLYADRRMTIVGPGVTLLRRGLYLSAGGSVANPVTIDGLEFTGQTGAASPVFVSDLNAVLLRDVYVHDAVGVVSHGTLTLERVRMARCTGACVQVLRDTDFDPSPLTVRWSEFRGTGSGTAIDITTCDTPPLTAQSNVFENFQVGIRLGCAGATTIVHNTFEANDTGIAFYAGDTATNHVLRNNIFSGQRVAAATCGSAGFTSRDYHLLWLNASNGCLDADPFPLRVNPLYVFPAAGDFRLRPTSPALNSATPLTPQPQLVPAWPLAPQPAFLGGAPDRGGIETY